jgi:hypothetical protein
LALAKDQKKRKGLICGLLERKDVYSLPQTTTMKSHKILFPLLGILGQMPTHIDPGTNEDSVSAWKNPVYFIPIVILIALVLLYFWTRKKQ